MPNFYTIFKLFIFGPATESVKYFLATLCILCISLYTKQFFFSFTEYEVIKDQPGDSYYVRAMFDRLPDPNAGPHQLTFRKDDILFIDNTMYNGTPGHWSAWLVDVDGQRGEWGVVPSKYKVCTF